MASVADLRYGNSVLRAEVSVFNTNYCDAVLAEKVEFLISESFGSCCFDTDLFILLC